MRDGNTFILKDDAVLPSYPLFVVLIDGAKS